MQDKIESFTKANNNCILEERRVGCVMDELLYRRYLKQVEKFGIPHRQAEEIVDVALSAGKGLDVEMYIDYAITLKYGLKVKFCKSC